MGGKKSKKGHVSLQITFRESYFNKNLCISNINFCTFMFQVLTHLMSLPPFYTFTWGIISEL